MWTILEDRSKRLEQSICKNEHWHLSERRAVWTIHPTSVHACYGVAPPRSCCSISRRSCVAGSHKSAGIRPRVCISGHGTWSINSSSRWYTVYTHIKIHTPSQPSLEPEIKCAAVAWFSPAHPPFVLKMPVHLRTSREQSHHLFHKKRRSRSQISKIKIIKVIQNLWQCQHPKITAITPDRKFNVLTDIKGVYSFIPYASPNLTLMQMDPEAMKHMGWRRACVTNGGFRSPWRPESEGSGTCDA